MVSGASATAKNASFESPVALASCAAHARLQDVRM